ncbi:MAG: PIN domain-containing protein [Acidobacteriaceae bacterium]|nr:PIN domain-containing protein [Acidobacteriaceae bacterium]
MNLVDTGPLVALIDRGQQEAHCRCVEALKTLSGALLTTWPCFTEAMYFLAELRGWSGQKALWNLRERGTLLLHTASSREADRMQTLMAQYQDVPMDLADASLVAAAEVTGLRLIFTLDSDFRIYRIHGQDVFSIVP